MKVSPPLSVAVIGTGFISEYHIDGIRAAGSADIVTLAGRDGDRTRRRTEEFGIRRYSTDAAGVFADPAIDAVVIATPDATHKCLAIAALEAGKAVLLQKPMAMNLTECVAIIDAASRSGAKLSVSFMHRYFPEVRWLRQQIQHGTYGKIHSVRLRNATPGADWADWLFNPESVAGGVIMQLGVHGIDLLQHLFGPVSAVSALSSTMKPYCCLADGRQVSMKLEDNVVAIYELESGVNVTHEMSWTENAGCDRFRLEVYFEDATVWLRTDEAAAMVKQSRKDCPGSWQHIDITPEPLGKVHHRHWLDVVRGVVPPDDTAEAGRLVTAVADQIYVSIVERRLVTVS